MEEKLNEIIAVPELLESLNIKGDHYNNRYHRNTDSHSKKIRKKLADYVLSLKGNHGSLMEDVREYFSDEELLKKCTYKKKVEKA